MNASCPVESVGNRAVLFDSNPYVDPFEDAAMRFRLTYAGPLYSTGNDPNGEVGKVDHKHHIRKAFHPQLKRLWDIVPFLKTGRPVHPTISWDPPDPEPIVDAKDRAKRFQIRPWNFVPLVTEDMHFYCGIEILFMRIDHTKAVISQGGDLDGRLKTLFDALAMPDAQQGYSDRPHESWENPMFVLLENDRLITKVSVETDQLLEPVKVGGAFDANDARLLMTVHISPMEPATWNLPLA